MGRQRVGTSRSTDDALQVLGHLVRRRRTERAMTIVELGARAGVSARTVSAVEHGSPSTAIGNVLAIMEALALPVFDIDQPAALAAVRRRADELGAFLPHRVVAPRTEDDDDDLDF